MIHLILLGLHQNEAWKSFVPTESRRHSREKLSPKKPLLSPYLQLNLQEAYLTLGLEALESDGGARSDGAVRCEVRQDHGRCFSPEHRDRLSPASACSGTSHLSADGARLTMPSSLVLPELEK